SGFMHYLATSQPALLPRFWPSFPIAENYPTTTTATLDGSATYFDCTANPPPPSPPSAPPINTEAFPIKFHFDFKLDPTGTTWLVRNGCAKKIYLREELSSPPLVQGVGEYDFVPLLRVS